MLKRVLDYQATQPRSRTNNNRAVHIPLTPKRLILATIRITIPRNVMTNNVELIATVGVRGQTGIAQLLFRVFRDGREIFNTQQGVESAGSEQNYSVTFQDIDTNVQPGTHTYRLTVENLTRNTTAAVVGPVNFSGLAIASTLR